MWREGIRGARATCSQVHFPVAPAPDLAKPPELRPAARGRGQSAGHHLRLGIFASPSELRARRRCSRQTIQRPFDMTTPLILQIQAAALDSKASVTDALRKAKLA